MSTTYPDLDSTTTGDQVQLSVSLSEPVSTTGRTRRFVRLLTLLEVIADFLVAVVVIVSGYGLATNLLPDARYNQVQVAAASTAIGLLLILLLDGDGAYRVGNSLLRVRETERILRACLRGFLVVLCIDAAFADFLSVRLLVLLATAVMAALVIEKQLLYSGVRLLHAKGFGVRNVVIYGAGYTGCRVFNAISRSPKLGLAPKAIIDDDVSRSGERIYERSYSRKRSIPILPGPVTKELLQAVNAEMVIAAIPSLSREKFLQVQSATLAHGAQFALVPNSHLPSDQWMEHSEIDGLMLATLGSPSERIMYKSAKRLFDIVASAAILVLSAPALALITALIRLESNGPAIFVQERIGRNGRPFNLYKFRTMYTDAPSYSYSPLEPTDKRITRVGTFLRRTSLDELPQLVNVLRPEMPFIVKQYLPRHMQRLQVKPGLTGLWQISADRAFLIHENIDYDLYYIRHRNFFMDLAILFHTLLFAARGI
jgi:lipopolysaccharide/colanic/teichoic acid biosynthesis glycosyltransferase